LLSKILSDIALTTIMVNPPLERGFQVSGGVRPGFPVIKSQGSHLFDKTPLVTATRIDNQHLTVILGVLINKIPEQFHMPGLVKNIAADDQIKQTETAVFIGPARA